MKELDEWRELWVDVGKLASRRNARVNGRLKFGGVASMGVMLNAWNEFGGMVRRLVLSRLGGSCSASLDE